MVCSQLFDIVGCSRFVILKQNKKKTRSTQLGKNTNWIKLEEGDLSDNQLTDIPSEIAELTQKQTNTKTKTIFETVASKWGNKLTSCTKWSIFMTIGRHFGCKKPMHLLDFYRNNNKKEKKEATTPVEDVPAPHWHYMDVSHHHNSLEIPLNIDHFVPLYIQYKDMDGTVQPLEVSFFCFVFLLIAW